MNRHEELEKSEPKIDNKGCRYILRTFAIGNTTHRNEMIEGDAFLEPFLWNDKWFNPADSIVERDEHGNVVWAKSVLYPVNMVKKPKSRNDAIAYDILNSENNE